MSEPTQQPNDSAQLDALLNGPEQPVSESEAPEGAETPEAPDVDALQAQLAEAHDKLTEATQRGDTWFEGLKLRTMEQAAGDLVQALDHMPADDPRYFDDSGFPSLTGMREVATELIRERPYLAKATGDVGQGVKHTETVPDWSDVVRAVFA